jgi:hypothetical protein
MRRFSLSSTGVFQYSRAKVFEDSDFQAPGGGEMSIWVGVSLYFEGIFTVFILSGRP